MTNDPKIDKHYLVIAREEYIDCVKTQFLEEYNIELSDSEITEIEEIV